MNQLVRNKTFAILLFVILAGAFYWFEWRPASIRANCMEQSVPINVTDQRDWAPERDIFEVGDALYQNCIRLHGLAE